MSSFAKFAVLQLLRAYKWAISPMFPPACRYVPTCSEYAMEAVDRFGALHGAAMAMLRLLRCHPFAKGGYDPVVRRDREICRQSIFDSRPLIQEHRTATSTHHRTI